MSGSRFSTRSHGLQIGEMLTNVDTLLDKLIREVPRDCVTTHTSKN